jgi:hypothetical protein
MNVFSEAKLKLEAKLRVKLSSIQLQFPEKMAVQKKSKQKYFDANLRAFSFASLHYSILQK